MQSAFAILANIGVAGAPDWLCQKFIDYGAQQRDNGRLTFSQTLVEKALQRSSRTVALPGLDEQMGIEVGSGTVHIGTGGAAVQVLDSASGRYRD